MQLNITNEVATLQRLTIAQLRQRFAELFGEATQASNRAWLVKRIAWRMQELCPGLPQSTPAGHVIDPGLALQTDQTKP